MPDIAPPHADMLTGARMPSSSPDVGWDGACHAVSLAVCSAMKSFVPSHTLPFIATMVLHLCHHCHGPVGPGFTQDWRPRSRKTLCRIRHPSPRRRTNYPPPRVATDPQPPSTKYKPGPPLRLHPSLHPHLLSSLARVLGSEPTHVVILLVSN